MATLAQVRYPPPTDNGWEEWMFAHAQHHNAIETSIAEVLGVPASGFALYPFFEKDLDRWLEVHQQAHQRFCQLLNISSRDLSDLDMKDKTKRDSWIWLNFIEHLGAAERLGTVIT